MIRSRIIGSQLLIIRYTSLKHTRIVSTGRRTFSYTRPDEILTSGELSSNNEILFKRLQLSPSTFFPSFVLLFFPPSHASHDSFFQPLPFKRPCTCANRGCKNSLLVFCHRVKKRDFSPRTDERLPPPIHPPLANECLKKWGY